MPNTIQESSLSRLYQHNLLHDCGALTAFRAAAACGSGAAYTHEDNRKRNRSLLAKLQSMGYSVTAINGKYPEGGTSKKEESFFVVDHKNTGTLEHDLKHLGDVFDQDSVLFIPRGAINKEAKAYLIGTNHCHNNWIGYGQTHTFDVGHLGHESPIYTSYINGRPFIFEEVGAQYEPPATGYGWWGLHLTAKKDWTQIVLPE
jgi:hypothetical protein